MDLAKEAAWSVVQNGLAAGATDGNSSSVDMAGYRSVTFLGTIGAQDAAATASLEAQQSDDDVTFESVAGAVITSAVNQDNKILVLEVRPTKRYVRTTLTRGGTGNTEWHGTYAIRHNGRLAPASAPASVHAATPVSV